ncbi:hypothetical protein cypCar_00018075 [Cyprinus carpio]|nr:hypothetical protein cypCar_00018075 [Cyprinus carpio]
MCIKITMVLLFFCKSCKSNCMTLASQAKSPPAKKIKKKENGIQPKKKPNKKKRTRPLKSSMKLSSSEKETSKAEKDCETHDGEGSESPALDALLTDLVKVNNSRDRANRLFQWLLHPVQDKSFFRDNWEKKPILIQRQNPDYYKGLFSTAEFDHILRNSGCSLRMLNPQAFSSTVWQVLSILQEKFGSMAGANVSKDEVLPLVSSPNFSQDEIGQPIMDVVLEAGDLLYFPRGFIHQGDCLPDAHSMHITVSSFQRNSWGDLLLKLMPAALEIAMEEDIEFRKGLPLDYLQFMGVQNSEKEDPRRDKFVARVEGLMKKLVSFAPVDAAVDQKARDFLHDCLPPVLSAEEKASSVYGAPARWGDGEALDVTVKLKGQTQIRLVRAGAARLCGDGETVSLFYTTENSRVYHKEEPKSIEMKAEHIDAMEFLIHSYPKFVSVASFPCETMEAKMSLAELLFEKGLIHTAE